MAQPVTAKFSEFLIKLGDGGTPEVFTKAPLAMVSRGFSTQINTTKITVPDQADEDNMVDERSTVNTRSRSMTGKGTLGKADYAQWEALLGTTFNAQVLLTGVGTWTGPVILTKLDLTGDRTNVVNVDVTLEQADELVFAA